MPPDDDDPRRPRIPDSLTFSQARVNHILGACLEQTYQTVLVAPLPEKLQSLINQLEGVLAARAPAPGHDHEESATGVAPRS